MGDEVLEKRKENIKKFFNEKLKLGSKDFIYLGIYLILMFLIYLKFGDSFKIGKNFVFIIIPIISIILFLLNQRTLAVLITIIGFSSVLRLQNLNYLIDVTTKQYIPADPDAMAFLRYAKYILEHGSLMTIDTLRYFPDGFSGLGEFSFLSHFIVYLYKFLHIFSSSFTIELIDIIYPAIAFAISLIFFFLLVKKLFNKNIALLATAFLSVVPSYLFRTLTGISDKEAFATIFFYAALYFYVCAWSSENIKKRIIFGALSGISTALTTLTWGGGVFIFLIIGLFTLIELFLGKLEKKDLYYYISWMFFSFLVLRVFFPERFNFGTLLLSTTTSITLAALLIWIINIIIFDLNLLKIKNKINEKIPNIIVSLIISSIIIALIVVIISGPGFFISKISETYNTLVRPFATNRWVRTVAENNQPYITDWIGQFGKTYLWLFLISSVILFYNMVKNLRKKAIFATLIYILFLFGFTFSRYSPSSSFNGESPISIFVYLGSLILFILFIFIFYIYSFYKNKELLNEIIKFDKFYTFMFIWFFVMIVGARSAIRLVFIFSPITAILASYLIFKIIEYLNKFANKNYYKILTYLIVGFFSLLILSDFASSSLSQSSGVGPTYNQQWQYMGKWIRENTKENSVFAHWWDYGYLVQYNNRATISDGGNAGGYDLNYFMGRNVLTGQTDEEALEFLKSKNATHFLAVNDEIGKYPAYSSIGSDVNYDRYSWITTFSLDSRQTQETRNETIYVYTGGFPLDEDFVYNNKIYPRQSAGIGAVLLPITETTKENVSGFNVNQPSLILVYNGEQLKLPLKCVFINNQKYEFKEGINGCFRVIPIIQSDNTVNPIGAGLYLSPKVKNSLFARLYLYNEQTNNFKVVYNDESQIPLAIYQGRLIGPYKIWEINYPKDLKVPEYFYKRELPEEVTKVKDF